MPTTPTASDFPSRLGVAIIPPPEGDAATNVLLLLHGLGDKKESFANLGRQMKLSETLCIAIDGPSGLLDLDGFHWGDDIMFDSSTGGLDADSGFKATNDLLCKVISDVLIEKCGYDARSIMLFGFGQGGMAALYAALSLHAKTTESGPSQLAGVVSIGAGLPSEASASLANKSRTPILICAGNNRSSVTPQSEEKVRCNFDPVEVKRYRRSGDSMPSNRDEMMPIMQFFSRRLLSRKGVPAGTTEIK